MSSAHRMKSFIFIKHLLLIYVVLALPGCANAPANTKKIAFPVKQQQTNLVPDTFTPRQLLALAIKSRKTSPEAAVETDSGVRQSKGIYLGAPYTAKSYFSPTSLRMDIRFGPTRELIVTSGKDRCWSQEPPVVHPCGPKARRQSQIAFAMDRAARLYPLLEQTWRLSSAKKGRCGQGNCYYLDVFHTETEETATLEFDGETLELNKLQYQGEMNGKTGTLETVFSDYQIFCHHKVPTVVQNSFDKEVFWRDTITEIQCRPVDETLFSRPTQVPDGTILFRSLHGETKACTTFHGSYLGYSEGVARLSSFLEKRSWVPIGPLENNLIVAPPVAKRERDYVTEQCFPIAQKEESASQTEGAVATKFVNSHEVLSIYSLGLYDEKNPVLMRLLLEEARERNLLKSGAFRLIRHTDISIAPADEWVSEIQMPVKCASECGASECGASECGASECGASESGASESGASECGASESTPAD